MNLVALLRLLNYIDSFNAVVARLHEAQTIAQPLGVLTAARPAFLAAVQAELQRPLLVITARADRARLLTDQLQMWVQNPSAVVRLPDPDALPYERVAWGRQTTAGRLTALTALASWNNSLRGPAPEGDPPPPLVVTSARALMQKTLPPSVFQQALRSTAVNQQTGMNHMVNHWLRLGYRPSEVVERVGQFSRRGGILDVFPPNEPNPIRIEFFGDEIDSLRSFDTVTQRSEAQIKRFVAGPASEALPSLAGRAVEALNALDLSNLHPVAKVNFEEDLVKLAARDAFEGVEYYLPFFYPQPANIVDYLPPEGLIFIEDPAELAAVTEDLEQQAADLRDDLIKQNELPAVWPRPFFTWAEVRRALRRRAPTLLSHADFPGSPAPTDVPPLQNTFVAAPSFGGQVKTVLQDVISRRDAGERVVLISRQAARLSDLLAERDVQAAPLEKLEYPPPPGSITVMAGVLLEGWVLKDEASTSAASPLTILSDAELFGWRKPQPRRRPARPQGVTPETFFADVSPGDYVVHIEHGIGIFQGLVKLDIDGVEREYLAVDYAQSDKLYVPIHQADRLSRYVGLENSLPTLNRLGSTDWESIKRRARRAVEEIARELLEVYAAREVVQGRAFSPDAPWQHELEAAFPYVETEDQMRAIAEVKRDMEKPKPMDRLICGDVGYGKTEVALRAAFKAVLDGTQVAMLVPTTVLAQQHFDTFRRRLAPYPVVVEMLSRFRTRKEQEKILAGLAGGSVDIVIGTHRLLQGDIRFKDLGLLIIDEEQRFGVTHKEKLKQMRTEVDVLTLTATPIPRTLHMSLTGVRDMSTIDTPPEERLAIKTIVTEYDETLIRT
ncbi:MAG: DEAD/DEAH box helicase, partial [Anaerolineae bacterium]